MYTRYLIVTADTLPCPRGIGSNLHPVPFFRVIRKETKMVKSTVNTISSFRDLKLFVYHTLCRDHELLEDAFPTSEMVLKRGSEKDCSCGVLFCLHGPRAVKISAIWERENNRVLFYGPTGKRYLQVDLQDITPPEVEITLDN